MCCTVEGASNHTYRIYGLSLSLSSLSLSSLSLSLFCCSSTAPTKLLFASLIRKVVKVAAAHNSTAVLLSDGTVLSWGSLPSSAKDAGDVDPKTREAPALKVRAVDPIRSDRSQVIQQTVEIDKQHDVTDLPNAFPFQP
jgi:hypothetical protein